MNVTGDEILTAEEILCSEPVAKKQRPERKREVPDRLTLGVWRGLVGGWVGVCGRGMYTNEKTVESC